MPTAPVEEKNLKLGNQPQEAFWELFLVDISNGFARAVTHTRIQALLEFLVCEVEEDPRQALFRAGFCTTTVAACIRCALKLTPMSHSMAPTFLQIEGANKVQAKLSPPGTT